jgi:hypothetical protein
MKQYVIDELRPADYRKIKSYLDEKFGSSPLDGISEHTTCQPFYFAIDLEANMMACELLIRTKARVRCDCISYATQRQRNWLIGFVDRMFKKLDIRT